MITGAQLTSASEDIAALLNEAKYEFDHGAFTTLRQADFFDKMLAAIAEIPPPEPPAPAPPPP